MQRVKKESQPYPEIDMTKPVQVEQIKTDPESCFGKMWDPYHQVCAVCAANELCAILYTPVVKSKVKAMQAKNAKFLDLTDFKAIDKEKLKKAIVANAVCGDPTTVEELFDTVSQAANTEDEVAVEEWMRRFIKENPDFSVKDGLIILKDVSK